MWNTVMSQDASPLRDRLKTTAEHPPSAALGVKKGGRHFGFSLF